MVQVPPTEQCTCDQICPGEPCACIFVPIDPDDPNSHGQCDCICEGFPQPHSQPLSISSAVTLETIVFISARDIELARLAYFLNARSAVELGIPARDATKSVSLKAKRMTLENAIEYLGLIVLNDSP